jgi:signal transduction histidine kinase
MARPSAGPYDRLVKRLATWFAGLPKRWQDLALALALAAYYVGSLIPENGQLGGPPGVAYALVVLEALPLTVRRRWPVATYFIVGIPRQLYDAFSIGFAPLPLASIIAFYTVMDRSSTRVRWVIGVLTLPGLIIGQATPGHTEPYDFFIAVLQFAVAGLAGLVSRTRRDYLQEVEARADLAEAERDQKVALVAAQERTRIARELHDVVAHHVSLMAVQSEAAASLLPGRPGEAAKSVQVIGQTAREALTELRRLLGVLRGPADPGGRPLNTAPAPSIGGLEEVLRPVRLAGIAVELRVEGNPSKLPPGVDVSAYRIVQEALTNTVRHSGASQAVVTVSYEPGYITVSVTDAGHRPAGRAATPAGGLRATPNASRARPAGSGGFGGFGLAGIAERVASCGGSLTVGPGREGGFAVTARLPTP